MMLDPEIFRQFQEIGRDLYVANLISSHGGNMSIRMGDRLLIKRRGAMLGRLREEDLVETDLHKTDSAVALASTELVVHRTIYLHTPALAVIHAHPRHAIALSLMRDEIVPLDVEASYVLRQVPVVAAAFAPGSAELAAQISAALTACQIVMHRGHGCFAIGQALEEAFHLVSVLEECAQIIVATKIVGEPIIEHRKVSEDYSKRP